jgi:hypothetical protein
MGRPTMGSMDCKVFTNDSLTFDSYAMKRSVQCEIIATSDNDTITIQTIAGRFDRFGFQILLFKDSCIVRHIIKSDTPIYKLKTSDSLSFRLSVPCNSYNLTLVNKPEFKKGEIIEGKIQLKSEEYYENRNSKDNKYKMEIYGYFKTDSLTSLGEKFAKIFNSQVTKMK